MFDNLIARAIVPVTIAVTGFVVFGCILLFTFIKSDMTDEAVRNLDSCAGTVVKSTRYAMMKDDRDSIQNIVTNIGTRSGIELVKIYNQDGTVRYTGREEPEALANTIEEHIKGFLQADTATSKEVQYDVDHANGFISVSMPILNEPQCSTAACHFHAEDEEILGFLSVAVSSDHLEKTLALLRNRMIIFSVMVLFLTIGGVSALLRMNLFLPILRLTDAAEQAVQGVKAQDLPKVGTKLGSLERNFRQLVQQRDVALHGQQPSGNSLRKAENGSIFDSRIEHNDSGHHTSPEAGRGKDTQA